PSLPATELTDYCYYNMFSGCTLLEVLPSLSHITTFATYCCHQMFYACKKVCVSTDSSYGELFITTGSSYYYTEGMFTSTGGEFTGSPATNTSYYTSNVVIYADGTRSDEYTESVSNYLTFCGDTNTFTTLSLSSVDAVGVNVKISNDTKTWETWDGTAYSVTGGQCYVCGYDNTAFATDTLTYCRFSGDFNEVYGNIMSLLEYSAPDNATMSDYAFFSMFSGCFLLEMVLGLELPATELTDYCYTNMFRNCTSLTTTPELPAMTLAGYCYSSMFLGCTSLIAASSLPAITLAGFCYQYMFYGCTSLEVIPSLAHVTTFANGCCTYMFYNCSNVEVSTDSSYGELLITTGDTSSYFSSMFTFTSGEFIGSPEANTSYYTSNDTV
ncbi:MAG: hypothetical protein LUI60_02080, partial [Clostridia bacterium]|nr:hypothetical protein [Clostridia bacterium]